MVIVTNTAQIKKGYADQFIQRFNKVGKVEEMEGFLGLEVLLTQDTSEHDEVTISTRWESKEAFLAWTRSEAFREAHAHRGGIPDYIIKQKVTYYDVKVVRHPIRATQ